MKHDAIVIGAGPTGVAAAIEGATEGLDVLLVDGGELSLDGVLRSYALDFHELRQTALDLLGDGSQELRGGERVGPRWSSALARARRQASAELARLWEELASIGVRVRPGPASFGGPGRIVLGDGSSCTAPAILLAQGCRPRRPDRFPWGGRVFRDPVSVRSLEAPPRTLLVIGAEEAGCETASLFAALGSEVTLLDRRRRMLRYIDRELAQLFYAELDEMGLEVALGETIESVREEGAGEPCAVVGLGSGRVQRWDAVVVAAGRVPELEGLELERVGVARGSDGRVTIDELHRANVEGVYAAGEAASGCFQWNALPQEGREAMRHALGAEVAEQPLPMGIHSIPEIAMVGFSEEMCAHLDVPHELGTVRYEELPLARRRGARRGMLKLVAERGSRRLLGAHAIGAGAHDLIQRAVTAVRYEETVDALAYGAVPSPSLSEAYVRAAYRCRWALAAPGPRGAAGGVLPPHGRQGGGKAAEEDGAGAEPAAAEAETT